MAGGNPLSGLGSTYRVSAPHHRERRPNHTAKDIVTDGITSRPIRGLFPFSVFPTTESNLPPANPNPPVMLRPQGFAPSRRLAPPAACRAYFIPVPLLGFPFEALIPPIRRTPSRAPRPSRGLHPKSHDFESPPQGSSTNQRSHPPARGLDASNEQLPPWVFSPLRFLAPRSAPAKGPSIPSRALPCRSSS
jgi:hypothetical protein